MITIIFDSLPPTINHAFSSKDRSRGYSEETKAWMEYAFYEAKNQMNRAKLGILSCKLYLKITFLCVHDRDIDNGLKVLLDSLQNAVYEKDKQIKSCKLDIFERCEKEKTILEFFELPSRPPIAPK